MKTVLLHTISAIAATLILAVQPVAAQDRSEDYQQGYRDGYRDAVCATIRALAPLMPALVTEPGEECEASVPDAVTATAAAPSVSDRCQRLLGLIVPLDAEIDRLLAAPTDGRTMIELSQAQLRRSEIDRELRRADC